jgi:peptide/nickel transport system permease protein
MMGYSIRRLLLSGGVLLAVSLGTFVFIATRFTPTCYSRYSTGALPTLASTPGQATVLWWGWLKGVPTGRSFGQVCGANIGAPLWPAVAHTAALLAGTALLVVVFSLALGTISATRAGSAFDVALRGFSYAAWAVPAFVLALALQSVFNWAGQRYGLHPFGTNGWPGSCLGQGGVALPSSLCAPGPTGVTYAADVVRHLVLPAVALAVAFIGVHSRYLRSSLLVALAAPYTTTARAKGLPERLVVMRHALRNSLATFTSALLLDFGAIFGAAMVVDWVFQLNGLGTLFITELSGFGAGDSARSLNPYAIEALLGLAALFVIASSFVAEVAVAAFDPRGQLR